jgi:hypothetical protein
VTIPSSAIPTPIVSPTVASKSFITFGAGTDQTSGQPQLSNIGRIALQQMRDYIVNMCRRFPANASTSSNVITLTLLSVQPTLTMYADFDDFGFVADATTTGNVTALVVTNVNGNATALATLNVYKSNGGTQAGSGDIVLGRQYWFTYVDSLNSNAGGFVVR